MLSKKNNKEIDFKIDDIIRIKKSDKYAFNIDESDNGEA